MTRRQDPKSEPRRDKTNFNNETERFVENSENPTQEEEQAESHKKPYLFDYNYHSLKKGVSSGLLDVALLMANCSQLKQVYLTGWANPFFIFLILIVALVISIVMQVVIGILLIWLGKININEQNRRHHITADRLMNVIVFCVFLLTFVNIFVNSIGTTPMSGLIYAPPRGS